MDIYGTKVGIEKVWKLKTKTVSLSRRKFAKGIVVSGAALIGACSVSRSGTSESVEGAGRLNTFIANMPKAELHVHIEGTVAPATAMEVAARNGISTSYSSSESFEEALNFSSLESFLKGFHDTIAVLQTEEDFYQITLDYLTRCHQQNVLHVDIKFDPQAHQRRGLHFDTYYYGIRQALVDAKQELGISGQLIMCFQRDAPLETAEAAFAEALKHQDHIVALGLDNTEIPNFAAKFSDLFERGRSAGFKLTSHCDLGQPNTLEHIRACIEDLGVDRLDHGYNILEDERLVQIALERNLCFTACPTSAYNTTDHSERFYFREVSKAIGEMLDRGLRVTVNTDDPGVMGNRHLNEVITDTVNHLGLSRNHAITLARNSFEALWLPTDEKARLLARLNAYVEVAG